MKSYNHLYEKFIDDDNIRLAIQNSSRGKRGREDVKAYLDASPEKLAAIRKYAENFKNKQHKPVIIYDGISRKKRAIIVPKYEEQIVHHMIVNILIPIFFRGMYEHSYASIPGRGAHRGKKVIVKWVRNDGRNCKYCLKMDIRKFFDSVPHDILLRKLREMIHDARFMSVLEEIISVTDTGIPLGFYTSQWLANWYLQGLDHFIKEDLGAAHYIRYMDDMVVFGPNKRCLHTIRREIDRYLREELGLRLKNNWQVFRFDYTDRSGRRRGRFLDFMGFRFYRDRVTLRRSIMLKASRKARRIALKIKPSIFEIRQILSYLGWLKCTDTYGMYKKWIWPYVNFQYCKRRIANYDRRIKEGGLNHGMVQGTKRDEAGGDGYYLVPILQLCAP